MKDKLLRYTLRVDRLLFQKFRYIAESEGRSANKEIEQYNQKAVEVMNELDVEINDLYTLSKTFNNSLHSDWVHFGTEGSKILADKVIEACFKS